MNRILLISTITFIGTVFLLLPMHANAVGSQCAVPAPAKQAWMSCTYNTDISKAPQCSKTATSNIAPIPHRRIAYPLDSGLLSNPANAPQEVFRKTVQVSDASWIQLHFAEVELGDEGILTIRSLQDQGTQRFTETRLAEWQSNSALFNGDAVEVVLQAGAGARGIFVKLRDVTAGSPGKGHVPATLCGTDDRIATTNATVGRIVPVGCTGWLVSNGAYLTAGHCPAGGAMTTLQFNVPASTTCGVINNPPPQDQYPITQNTITFANNGLGDDWAIFGVGRNTNNHLPVEEYGGFNRMSRDDAPVNVRVSGYGTDETPPGACGGRNADSQTLQTNAGGFLGETVNGASDVEIEYLVDSEGGNSGSPVFIDGTTMTMGIHTNGGCTPPNQGNFGTGFENDNLETAIADFPDPNAFYADSGHTALLRDGSVLRPFRTVTSAVSSVPSGGLVSIVAGSYTAANGNIFTAGADGKAMTLVAPVGSVTIGN